MLKEPNNDKNQFLKRYFNWGYAPHTMNGVFSFYHIPTHLIVPFSSQSSIVNLILEKEYLKPFTFNGAKNVCIILYNVCLFLCCIDIRFLCFFFVFCYARYELITIEWEHGGTLYIYRSQCILSFINVTTCSKW